MAAVTVGCVEAEAAVLGALMRLHTSEADALAAQLVPEDFIDPRNRAVLGAIVGALADHVQPDPVTVLGELRRAGHERCWTADRSAGVYLFDLLAAAPTAVNARHYARVVVEHRARRRLHEAAERLGQLAGTASLTTVREIALDEWTAVIGQLDRVTSEAGQVFL
jgi:replicative DNA helicase